MKSGLSPGYVLAEKYKLVACVGRGGMGEVWRALHLALNADVAIKFIHTQLSGASDTRGRFVREAQAAAALRSPHVVQILDYGVDGDVAYMVMELLRGESLAARFRRERISPSELARVMTHVARALSKAHEAGIVHRDLKPDNIYLTHADDELIAKVLDFGVAKFQKTESADASTRTGALLGTPYYMSPEQAEGTRKVDHRADIWAMGVIAFEGLTGQRPFDSEALGNLLLKICTHPIPVPSQVAAVPLGFDQWFATAVQRDVSKRFASAKEAADALTRVCKVSSEHVELPLETAPTLDAGVAAPPALALTNQPLARTLNPGASRSRTLRRSVLGAIAVLGISGLVYWGRNRANDPPAASTGSVPAESPPPSNETAKPPAPPTESIVTPVLPAASESSATTWRPPTTPRTGPKPAASAKTGASTAKSSGSTSVQTKTQPPMKPDDLL